MSWSLIGQSTSGAKRMLRDRCIVLTWVAGATNAYGYRGKPTYQPGNEIPCSYQEGSASEAAETVFQVQSEDATIWIELSTSITHQDRVQLTKRSGKELASPITYIVFGDPERDVILQRVKLKLLIEKTS